jgi:hypothetical protein
MHLPLHLQQLFATSEISLVSDNCKTHDHESSPQPSSAREHSNMLRRSAKRSTQMRRRSEPTQSRWGSNSDKGDSAPLNKTRGVSSESGAMPLSQAMGGPESLEMPPAMSTRFLSDSTECFIDMLADLDLDDL